MGTRRRLSTRALVRAVAFVLGFAVSVGLSGLAVERTVVWLDPERSPMSLDMIGVIRQWQAGFVGDESHRRIALIGDSMLAGPPGSVTLPEVVERVANRRKRRQGRISIHTLIWPAWTMIGEYCMADEVIRAKPDAIVLELNLRALELGPLGAFGYTELAGWIQSSRLREAALLPLLDAGITLNRLLLYKVLVASHLEDAWMRLLDRQARFLHAKGRLEAWVERKTGISTVVVRQLSFAADGYRRVLVPGRLRARPEHVMRMLGTSVAGLAAHNGRLEVLVALVRTFKRAGIPVLVWVSPVNVQYMRSLGLSMDGLDRSLETVRAVVEPTGARFLDLHALLADSAFRDSGDHYTLEGDPNGAAILASRLVPAIQRTTPPSPLPKPKAAPPSNAEHAVQ